MVIHAVYVDTTDARPQAAIERKTKRYPTDLSDEEWEHIEPLLPATRRRKPAVDLRDPLRDALRLRLAHAAEGLPAPVDGVLVVRRWFRASGV